MRPGIIITVTAADRARLEAVVADRNSPQKHVWRAAIVLGTADRLGTNAIKRVTGKSKTAVWRWQERCVSDGVDGLFRDKTRPSRIAPFGPEVGERIVALTLAEVLLTEVNHRVANNLSFVGALIRMQRQSITDTKSA